MGKNHLGEETENKCVRKGDCENGNGISKSEKEIMKVHM